MEYPKALYRDGDDGNHQHWGDALLVGGKYQVETRVVLSASEEEDAKREGWREKAEAPSPLDHDLDGEAGGSLPKRGPGRPPRTPE